MLLFQVIYVSSICSLLNWKEDFILKMWGWQGCGVASVIASFSRLVWSFAYSIKVVCVVVTKSQEKRDTLFTGLEKSKLQWLTSEGPIVWSLTGAGFDSEGQIPLPLKPHGSLTLKGVCTHISVGPGVEEHRPLIWTAIGSCERHLAGVPPFFQAHWRVSVLLLLLIRTDTSQARRMTRVNQRGEVFILKDRVQSGASWGWKESLLAFGTWSWWWCLPYNSQVEYLKDTSV